MGRAHLPSHSDRLLGCSRRTSLLFYLPPFQDDLPHKIIIMVDHVLKDVSAQELQQIPTAGAERVCGSSAKLPGQRFHRVWVLTAAL